MSSLPDAVQILQAMSCSEKLSKVVTAVKEALDDGVCPQKVDDAVESLLNKYRPFPGQNYLKGPVPTDVAALQIPAHIANTDSSLSYARTLEDAQRALNAASGAAATCYPKPSARAMGLTDRFLEATQEASDKWRASRYRQEPTRGPSLAAAQGDEMAHGELCNIVHREDGPAAGQKTKKKNKTQLAKRVRGCSAIMLEDDDEDTRTLDHDIGPGTAEKQYGAGYYVFNPPASDLAQLEEGGEWIAAMTRGAAPGITQKKKAKDTGNTDNQVAEPAKHSPINKDASGEKPSTLHALTPANRGRPFDYRKQANSETTYPDGTRATHTPTRRSHSKSKSLTSSGSDKKRRVSAATDGSKPSEKRLRQEDGNHGGVGDEEDEEGIPEDDSDGFSG